MVDPEFYTPYMTEGNQMYSSGDNFPHKTKSKETTRPKSEPKPKLDEITISIFQQNSDPPFMTNTPDYYFPAELLKSNWFSKASANARYNMHHIVSHKVTLDFEDSPAILMGKTYYPRTFDTNKPINYTDGELGYKEFIRDFSQIIWITYRSGFRPINRLKGNEKQHLKVLTTDAGWGCTIRAGQMMLLNALKRHFNYEDNFSLLETIQENLMTAPFSVHKITELGVEFDKIPGDWYSPSTICHTIERLIKSNPIPNFKAKVFMDSVIYRDQLISALTDIPYEAFDCEEENGEECNNCFEKYLAYTWDTSILIMLPVMLGLKTIQREFNDAVKYFLSMPQTVGIVGGKPRSALYFVGYQEENFIFLDPHLVQKVCKNTENLRENQATYSCSSPKIMPISEAESSMSLGFYIRNKEDYVLFERLMEAGKDQINGLITLKMHTPDYCRENYQHPAPSEGDDYIIL